MGYNKSKNEILDLIEAKYPFIQIVSEDDIPVIQTFVEMSKNKMTGTDYEILTWNLATGIFCEYGESTKKGFIVESSKSIEDKVIALFEYIKKHEKNAVFILQDFDFVLKEYRHLSFGLKDVVQSITRPLDKHESLRRHIAGSNEFLKHIVVVSTTQYIPRELDKLVNVVNFEMPGREEIEKIINKVLKNTEQSLEKEEFEKIVTAAYGLTETELTNALFKSIVSSDNGKMNATSLSMLKEQIIKKGGIVEFITPKVGGMKNIGGMVKLKEWIEKRKITFDEEVRESRNLSYPKGILKTGIQGAGKSFAVKAISEDLGMPLIRFDIGKVKGMYVGESEENMRKAIALAEAVSPCILWVDEIEKAFPDPRNANTHEVSKSLLGYFLTWMQEKSKPVFVVATANNIDTLPPELLRKGRFDETFWVDLPNEDERRQIFKIHLKKVYVKPEDINLSKVVTESDGYSGAEIEAVIHEANITSAYNKELLSTEYIINELKETTPISIIRADAIKEMREWAKTNKVRPAN